MQLGSPDWGGFAVEVCHNATSAMVAERLEDFLIECRPEDLALVRLASTAIDAALINLVMRGSRALSIVLLLDCCYGGAFERGMAARAAGTVPVREQFSQERLGGGRGRVVITASSAVQYAFDGSRLADERGVVAPSRFTGSLVDGIRTGEADRDADGFVSLGEIFDYVYESVLKQTTHQTPSKWEYGMEGDVIIARSPRRLVRPADLPPPLVEVIQHAYPVARRGAVEELARLAGGSDLPIAVSALEALRGMCEDDSRSIASAAVAAVDVPAVTASTPVLSFGEITVGAASPVLTCELIGPPLAGRRDLSGAGRLRGPPRRPGRPRPDGCLVAWRVHWHLCIHTPNSEVRVPNTGVVRPASPATAENVTPPGRVGSRLRRILGPVDRFLFGIGQSPGRRNGPPARPPGPSPPGSVPCWRPQEAY